MEVLFVLALIGGGAYWFLRGNVRRGAEIMRAHIFLGSLRHGKSVAEANGYASADMSNLPPEFVHNATLRANHEYGGQKLVMVGGAYRLGMHPNLPIWEQSSINVAFQSWLDAAPEQRSPSMTNTFDTEPLGENFPADYSSYYEIYMLELKRLSGLAPNQHHHAELMEELGEATGDNLTRQNFENGVDPKEYAAAVHAVMQRMPPGTTAL